MSKVNKIPLSIELLKSSEFYKTRPKAIKKLMNRLPGTHAYEIIDTGHECNIYSYSENGTVSVIRAANENDHGHGVPSSVEWIKVFGLKPEDLKILSDKPVYVDPKDVAKESIAVIKIERLPAFDEEPRVFLRNENKSITRNFPLTSHIKTFLEDKDEIYVEACISNDEDQYEYLSIIRLLKDQKW